MSVRVAFLLLGTCHLYQPREPGIRGVARTSSIAFTLRLWQGPHPYLPFPLKVCPKITRVLSWLHGDMAGHVVSSLKVGAWLLGHPALSPADIL